MGCAPSAAAPPPPASVAFADLSAFVEQHCELSPKAHVAVNELAGALHVFLRSRGHDLGPAIPAHLPHQLMSELVAMHGLVTSGPDVRNPLSYSHWNAYKVVCGIRIKVFPVAA